MKYMPMSLFYSMSTVSLSSYTDISLQWRHNGRDGVSNHQPHDCLLNRLFRRRSKKTSKLPVTGLCVGISPGTGEFPTQRAASNLENVSILWHHHFMFSVGITRPPSLLTSTRLRSTGGVRAHIVSAAKDLTFGIFAWEALTSTG